VYVLIEEGKMSDVTRHLDCVVYKQAY